MADVDPWANILGKRNPIDTLPVQPHQSVDEAIEDAVVRNYRASRQTAARNMAQYVALPAEGVGAVLGAAQRAQASRIGNLATNPRGVLESQAIPLTGPLLALLDPKGREQLGNEAYAAFHPNDPTIEGAAEKATGVNRLRSTDPRFRGKLQNFAVETGFQNLTDPLNYASAGTAGAGEMLLKGFDAAATAAARSSEPILANTAGHLITNVPERLGGFNRADRAKINTIHNKADTQARAQKTLDSELLRKGAKELKVGNIPPEIRQRLLREAYVYGNQSMRKDAVLFGYKPTAEEEMRKPMGLLEYNLRDAYEPQTGYVRSPLDEVGQLETLLPGESETMRAPKAGFEMQQRQHRGPHETLRERVAARLAAGRAVVKHRMATEDLQKHLGIGKEMAASMAAEKRYGGFKGLQALSRAQVDALLSTGLPHMRNITVAGHLAMGEGGLVRATDFFARGVPKALSERLEEGGASHFGIREPGKYSPARLMPQAVRGVTTGALDRWDNALRAARLEQLDKEFPKMDELEKLDRVNQDLGAYNLKPQYVAFLQGIGANFPQWHSYIVPTMVGRALIRNPGRVARLARYEQNANDAFLPNANYRVTLGGPVDEAASAAADPLRILSGKYPTYFGGPSTIGPMSYLLNAPPHVGAAQRALEAGSTLVPFGPTILDVLRNPYKEPIPPAARAAASLTGVYTQKRTPGSMARTRGSSSSTSGGADPWAKILAP